MKKKVIFSTSGAGSVGKTMISSFYVDQARNRLGIEIETYLCDLKEKHDALYQRYGQRVDGDLLPLDSQNALLGVKPLDLFMQSKANITDQSEMEILRKRLADQFSQALDSDADIVLFDMPATHFSDIYTKLFSSIDEFAGALDFSEREIYISMPFADDKSLSSISSIYADTKNIENIKYIVAINKGKFDTSNGIDSSFYYNSPVYKELFSQRERYYELILPTLKPDTINAIDNHHLSDFFNYDDGKAVVIREKVKPLKNAQMVNQNLLNLTLGVKHINSKGKTIEFKLLDEISKILGE